MSKPAASACSASDPYHDHKIYHKAGKMNDAGQVSALCFPRPHAINLTRELWTLRDKAVTCRKCLKILAATKTPNDIAHAQPDKPKP